MKGGEWYIATMQCIQFMAQERLWITQLCHSFGKYLYLPFCASFTFPVSSSHFHFPSFFLSLSLEIVNFYTFTFQTDYIARVLENPNS